MISDFEISVKDCSKKYGNQSLFKHINLEFRSQESYAILGPNGSGKSTFLGILSGFITQSEGTIIWKNQNQIIDRDNLFKYLSFASPYMKLPEDLTISEIWNFHFKLKHLIKNIQFDQIMELCQLKHSIDKPIKYFSSGMKMRLKLALSICTDSSLLLLDEPCTNLDKEGINLYHKLLDLYSENRLIILASNQPDEFERCSIKYSITDFIS